MDTLSQAPSEGAADSDAAQQPIGTPPGGGEWTWDAVAGAWVPVNTTAPE